MIIMTNEGVGGFEPWGGIELAPTKRSAHIASKQEGKQKWLPLSLTWPQHNLHNSMGEREEKEGMKNLYDRFFCFLYLDFFLM